jgi:hypothetical protein
MPQDSFEWSSNKEIFELNKRLKAIKNWTLKWAIQTLRKHLKRLALLRGSGGEFLAFLLIA